MGVIGWGGSRVFDKSCREISMYLIYFAYETSSRMDGGGCSQTSHLEAHFIKFVRGVAEETSHWDQTIT